MNKPTRVIAIGASAGGVRPLMQIASALPPDFSGVVLVVLHVGTNRSILPQIMSPTCPLPVSHACEGDEVGAGRVLVAPPDHHMLVVNGRVVLTRGAKENNSRPAIDPLFRSIAIDAGPRAVGVILSGRLDDGTAGLQAIKRSGGIAIVQNPVEADEPSMPQSALNNVDVDHTVSIVSMAPLLTRLTLQRIPLSMTAPFDDLKHEQALSLRENDPMPHLKEIGAPSTYTCPDCHGTLWEISGASPARFRCHTGHAYTLRLLRAELAASVDESLWNALRATEEQQILLKRMLQAPNPQPDVKTSLEACERHLHTLEHLVTVPSDTSQ